MRQLTKRERVAASFGEDLVAHTLVDGARERAMEQLAGMLVGKPPDVQSRQLRERLRDHPDREHNRDPLCFDASCDERERLGRCIIQPVCIVDHTKQRLLIRELREQTEYCQADQERIRRRRHAQAERSCERIALWGGQPIEDAKHGTAQHLKTRVRELHLGFRCRDSMDLQVRTTVRDGVIEQCRLAHAGLAIHHDRAALTGTSANQQRIELSCLPLAPKQGL